MGRNFAENTMIASPVPSAAPDAALASLEQALEQIKAALTA